MRKVVTRFDKRNSDTVEKKYWWREKSIAADPEEEDPISEDPRENSINEKPKEHPCHCEI